MWTLRVLLCLVLLAGTVSAQQSMRFPAASSFSTVDLVNPVNRSSPLNKGLVGWWINLPQINRAGTTFRDISGYGHHGTLTNMATTPPTSTSGWNPTTRQGGYGQLAFDGTNDYGEVLNKEPLNFGANTNFSVSVWVYPTSLSSTKSIVTKSGTAGWTVEFIDTGIVRGNATDGTHSSTPQYNTLLINTWTHIMVTFERTVVAGIKVYKNGILQSCTGSCSSDFTTVGDINTTNSLGIATRNPQNNGSHFPGSIDDILIYNRAFSPREVLELYNDSLLYHYSLLNRLPFAARTSAAAASSSRRFFQFFRLLPDGFQWPVPWREVPATDQKREIERAS